MEGLAPFPASRGRDILVGVAFLEFKCGCISWDIFESSQLNVVRAWR